MSDVLKNLAAVETFLEFRGKWLTKETVLREDAAMTRALAEAMTNAEHIYMKTLSQAQQQVALLRLEIGDKWPEPDVMDSYVFLVSEIGEVGDALLRANFGHRTDYSRNNTKCVDVTAELGDAYLMLCTLATALGIDLDTALQGRVDHLREKHDITKSSNNP